MESTQKQRFEYRKRATTGGWTSGLGCKLVYHGYLGLVVLIALNFTSCAPIKVQEPSISNEQPVATFSILGYDPNTGEMGGAVQSRVFSVGNGVLWGEAGIGMIATQAYVDVSYGPKGLTLLRAGHSPSAVVDLLLEGDSDPYPENWPKAARQFAIMDTSGVYHAHTGTKASHWAGHQGGVYVTAQGNILAGEAVVVDMVKAFEQTEGHLSLRLMAALDAGQRAGGDTRGMQSASLLIIKKDGGPWLHNDVVMRLQVDDNDQPLKELRRLIELTPQAQADR
jgi:uncharacterized Ntn-hydrolase superfamily protein